MSDMINRQDAIDALKLFGAEHNAIAVIKGLPSAEPEVKPISYTDCANAMLMMWMDEVKPISYTDCANAMLMMWMDEALTDGEYNRIMDKLNAYEMKKREENG